MASSDETASSGVFEVPPMKGWRRFESYDENGELLERYEVREEAFNPARCDEMRRTLLAWNTSQRALAPLPPALKLLA